MLQADLLDFARGRIEAMTMDGLAPAMRRFLLGFAPAAFALLPPCTASAHPHVIVTVRSTIVTDQKGDITEVRQAWSFDEAFSAYSTTGLDKNKNGKLEREELVDLAKVNVESLHEYSYFTVLKNGKASATFGDVRDYWLSHDGKVLTLHFTMPLAARVPAANARLEVADPTYFVAFDFADTQPVAFEGEGGRCTAEIKRPAQGTMQRLSQLSESFFQSLQPGSGAGAEWASPARISCK
jgi:ABC-type uncharacterized transport system substrate-binding protein